MQQRVYRAPEEPDMPAPSLTHYRDDEVKATLTPEASQALLDRLLERSECRLVLGVVLVEEIGGRCSAIFADGTVREVSFVDVQDERAAGVVAVADAERRPPVPLPGD